MPTSDGRPSTEGSAPPDRGIRARDNLVKTLGMSHGAAILRKFTACRDTLNGMRSDGKRVLVVDDEPSIVDAVATALRYEGYDVEESLDRS
jgi:PleD family two-component response regulator